MRHLVNYLPLVFYLPTGGNTKIMLKKNNKQMTLKLFNDTVVHIDEEYNYSASFTRGNFKWYKATKEDSGDYVLEKFAATDGTFLHKIKIHLEIRGKAKKGHVLYKSKFKLYYFIILIIK